MIQPSELRIGNWLIDNNKYIGRQRGLPVCVESINQSGINLSGGGYGGCIDADVTFENLEAIPLTTDVLQSCEDFEKGKGLKIQRQNYPHGDLFIDFIDDVCYLQNCHDGYIFGKPIEFVHQLQNLYFSLTGQELNFKP